MRSSLTDPLSILVVDDDDQMLKTVGDILRFKGYHPVGAPTAHEGLKAAAHMELPPAIALVDLRLPDMDGIELIARLRAVSELTEVVILTGNASLDSAVRALREQSYDYLVKPVQPEYLLNSVDRAAERWRRKSAEAAMRESQKRLRRIFDNVRDGLFITDESGRILDANPAATELAGLTLEALKGTTIASVLGEAGPPATLGERSAEYHLRRPGGEPRIVDAQSATFAPGMYVHTVRDLTERRRLEEELHQSRKMDAIGRLAGGVAHDINNVLTAITCYSEMLLADLMGEDARRADVLEIRNAAQRAAALTGQLLAFSRKQILKPQVLDLNIVVSDMERMLARVIGEDVSMSISPEPALWPIRADRGQLEQVVMNLAVNARDAMPRGGTITIETANVTIAKPLVHRHGIIDPGDYVVLRVSDRGSGMPEEVLTHLFEPFFTTKGHGKGTGLGLSTVYGIITQSNGKIEVASGLETGTTFTIYLPRERDETPVPAPYADPAPPSHRSGHETMLLVEDDAALRGLMVRLLQQEGYHVLAAGEAGEALLLAEQHAGELDLMLVDVVMPGMNGRELADRVIAANPRLKVLYMSGYTDDALLHRGVSDLERSLLQKPFSTHALTQKIREVLDGAPLPRAAGDAGDTPRER
jgi:PAS domain S-box-containing protein